jgi:sigma-54 dependent transcriptional regulator, acetoin dehydrogenase operon transcriptional activator AcoR
MPRALQARLLRVLAEREVLPIGATRPTPVNMRVIAATHRPLETLVREGSFRDDLYYRLNGAHVQLPPLRERSDLGWLVDRMLREGLPADTDPPVLLPEAWALLRRHHWPGNLRELRNALDYARAVCGPGGIAPADLPDALRERCGQPPAHRAVQHPAAGATGLEDAEARQLLEALQAAHWNVSEVARRLGLSRMTLYRRMKRWGIVSPVHGD